MVWVFYKVFLSKTDSSSDLSWQKMQQMAVWPGSWVARGCVCHREESLPTHCSESTGDWIWRRKLTCLQLAGIWMHGVGLGPCVPYLFLVELCWVALADSVSQPKGGLFPRASGSHCCFLAHHHESQILFWPVWPRSSSAMTVAAAIPFYKWKQTQGISQNLMNKPSEAFFFHNLFLHRRKKKIDSQESLPENKRMEQEKPCPLKNLSSAPTQVPSSLTTHTVPQIYSLILQNGTNCFSKKQSTRQIAQV